MDTPKHTHTHPRWQDNGFPELAPSFGGRVQEKDGAQPLK